MRSFARWSALPLLLALALPASAQGVGSTVPPLQLENYANTTAKSFDEFVGRAVLVEFFAYW